MNTISQGFFDQLTTSRAHLARVAWIHEDHLPTGTFCLVGGELHELIPRNVRNTFVEFMTKYLIMVAHHVFDGKLLKNNDLICIHQAARQLMGKVLSSVRDLLVNMRNLSALFCSLRSFLLRLAQSSLGFHKTGLICPEKPGIVNLLSGGKRGKRSEADIDADHSTNNRKNVRYDFAGKAGIPFPGSAPDGQGLDYAFDLPVFFHSHGAGPGEFKPIVDEDKATLREGEAVVPVCTSEPWVAGLFSSLYPSEESTEGKVNPHRNILKALGVGMVKSRIFFLPCCQKITCIITGDRFLPFFPSLFSGFKSFVVYPPASIKRALQCFLLFCRGVQSELICLTHDSIIDTVCVNVKNYFKGGARLTSAT